MLVTASCIQGSGLEGPEEAPDLAWMLEPPGGETI